MSIPTSLEVVSSISMAWKGGGVGPLGTMITQCIEFGFMVVGTSLLGAITCWGYFPLAQLQGGFSFPAIWTSF